MYAVLDELEGGVTVAQYPTALKALNAARRIEPRPEGKPLGYRSAVDEMCRTEAALVSAICVQRWPQTYTKG